MEGRAAVALILSAAAGKELTGHAAPVMERTQAQSHEEKKESFLSCVLALGAWESYPPPFFHL